MTTTETTLPAYAYHLRIHERLELHGFDREGRLSLTVPLRDRLYTLGMREVEGQALYCIEEARQDDSQRYRVHFPITLPSSESHYYDPGDDFSGGRTSTWFFQAGFGRNEEEPRTGTLTGIGTVDIADISILPDLAARVGRGGWLRRLWRCLFPVPAQPAPKGLLGIPSDFPDSNSFLINLRLTLSLPADPVVEGAQCIRIGAFMGQETEDGAEQAHLLICANPALLQLEAMPLVSGK